jgi:membrane protease YdiL (CAAX protease family)
MLAANCGRSGVAKLATALTPHGMTAVEYILTSLFATTVTVGSVLLYCLLAERRSLVSLGFIPKRGLGDYTIGLAFGLLMFGVAVLLCTVCGTLTLTPASEPPSIELLLLFFAGFLIQGMSEELLCRSFLMVSLSRGLPLWLCAVVNALLFSIIHMGNPGVSVIALVNIFLFGIFASLLTLRRGSIWMVGALHSMWNFAQGNLFGIPVSGLSGIPSPLRAELTEGGWQTLINGGDFGLEGGLAVTVVMAVGCVVLLISPMRKTATSEA